MAKQARDFWKQRLHAGDRVYWQGYYGTVEEVTGHNLIRVAFETPSTKIIRIGDISEPLEVVSVYTTRQK